LKPQMVVWVALNRWWRFPSAAWPGGA